VGWIHFMAWILMKKRPSHWCIMRRLRNHNHRMLCSYNRIMFFQRFRPGPYSQVQNICPHPCFNFLIFVQPLTLFGSLFINFKEIVFLTNPSFNLISLLVLFMPNFYDKIAYCCIYFSVWQAVFVLSILVKSFSAFSEIPTPCLFQSPCLVNFRIFPDPLVY